MPSALVCFDFTDQCNRAYLTVFEFVRYYAKISYLGLLNWTVKLRQNVVKIEANQILLKKAGLIGIGIS